MKDPKYYGKARYVDEVTFNPDYLDSLTSAELDSFANNHEGVTRTVALLIMSKKYVEHTIRWEGSVCSAPVDVEECRDYLRECNILLRDGLNNEYKELLVFIWPKMRKIADKLAYASADCDELSEYSRYRKAADMFVESRGLDLELEDAMAEEAEIAFIERNGNGHEAFIERNGEGHEAFIERNGNGHEEIHGEVL